MGANLCGVKNLQDSLNLDSAIFIGTRVNQKEKEIIEKLA